MIMSTGDRIGAVTGGMREWTPGQLARMAATFTPELDSLGAGFLAVVRDAFVEAVEQILDPCVEDLLALDAGVHVEGCLPSDARQVWGVFVDLGAWEELVTDVGDDMTALAVGALEVVGRRLFDALAWWVVDMSGAGASAWPAVGVRR